MTTLVLIHGIHVKADQDVALGKLKLHLRPVLGEIKVDFMPRAEKPEKKIVINRTVETLGPITEAIDSAIGNYGNFGIEFDLNAHMLPLQPQRPTYVMPMG